MTGGAVLAALVAVCVTVLAVVGSIDGDVAVGVLGGLSVGVVAPTPRALTRGRG